MQTDLDSSFYTDQPHVLVEQVITNIQKVIVGKRDVIEKLVVALLTDGHVLLEDVPGVGKTMLVRAMAKTVDCTFKRIQFTPDLLPTDITGVAIYNQKTSAFEYRPGPLMAHIVLADEINRTSPKTQAALLEAMAEKSITVDGTTYPISAPFLILATQNPLDYEGTFSLPEAQLDRFLLRIRLGYPAKHQEVDMLSRMQDNHPIEEIKPVLTKDQVLQLQKLARSVHMNENLKHYIVSITEATRQHPDISLGASPRASIALMKSAQTLAFIRGRTYTIPDDIKQMLQAVIAHRILLKADRIITGKDSETVLANILHTIPVPTVEHTDYRTRRSTHKLFGDKVM